MLNLMPVGAPEPGSTFIMCIETRYIIINTWISLQYHPFMTFYLSLSLSSCHTILLITFITSFSSISFSLGENTQISLFLSAYSTRKEIRLEKKKQKKLHRNKE